MRRGPRERTRRYTIAMFRRGAGRFRPRSDGLHMPLVAAVVGVVSGFYIFDPILKEMAMKSQARKAAALGNDGSSGSSSGSLSTNAATASSAAATPSAAPSAASRQ